MKLPSKIRRANRRAGLKPKSGWLPRPMPTHGNAVQSKTHSTGHDGILGRHGEGPSWEYFPHGSDVGIRAIGPTKSEAFVFAATALAALAAEPGTIRPMQAVPIACHAPNDELLLVDWLNALIHEMVERKMLFSDFEVQLHPGTLRGWARGEAVDSGRHQIVAGLKGVTLAELRVGRGAAGQWFAQCVVDV